MSTMNNFWNQYNPDILNTLSNLSNDEVFTPPEIVNQMLDLLPQEIWSDKNATFLDPATKSGVFLREIAKRLIRGLESQIPILEERLEHILNNQLYGIAITEITSLIARRSLYCSKFANSKFSVVKLKTIDGNVRFKKTDHKWNRGKCLFCGASINEYKRELDLESHAYEFIHNEKVEELFNVKFDVIIGNPPYQLNDGGGSGSSAIPLYQKFIQQSKKLNPTYLCMIVPSRWFTGGKGLDDFRSEMIKDRRIKVLHDYINAQDCFPNVKIEGGVCYFLLDRAYSGKTEIFTHQQNGNVEKSYRYLDEGSLDIFVRDYKVLEIVMTVLSKKHESFSSIVFPRNAFGVGNSSKQLSQNSSKNCSVFGRFDGKRGYRYIDKRELVKNTGLIDKYKLFVSKADGAAGQIGNPIPARILGKTEVGLPNSVCTETFLVVGPFISEKQMKNVQEYMKTKFFRFLAGSRKNKNMTQDTYKFVPLVDFDVEWDDSALFNYFSLSDSQIKYINEMITDYDESVVEDLGGDDTDEE